MIFLLEAAQQLNGPEEINFGALIVRMLIFLGLILLIIFLLLKRVLPLLVPSAAQSRTKSIRILERVQIDQRKSLIVAEIQEKVYLLGSSDGQINILLELDREKILVQSPIAPSKPLSFSDILKRTLSREKSS
jgi:flagellar biosynthetic protein FliO